MKNLSPETNSDPLVRPIGPVGQVRQVEADSYYDNFELWAQQCVCIIDKITCRPVPFVLNAPQRKLLGVMERQRRSGMPIRVILLKARQWGGSTLVQVYMAWMQLVRRKGWNSLICAHLKDASAGIRGMYTRLLREYPEALKYGRKKSWELVPYEKSTSTSYLAARDCTITVGSSLSPNALRGTNLAMAHLSEVAFWGDGNEDAASQIVRTVAGTIPREADTLVVMESTADGRSNYFYHEWQRAVKGESDKTPVFVAWHEIEIYRKPVAADALGKVVASLDTYERDLLERGVSIESVAWYHDKRREYSTHAEMMAEYPSTPDEAFATSGSAVFPPAELPKCDHVPSAKPALAVLVIGAGSSPSMLTLFADLQGVVVPLLDMELTGAPAQVLAALRRVRNIHSYPIAVAERPDAETARHGRWLARRLEESGCRLFYGDNDAPLTVLDDDTLSDAIDTYREMLTLKMVKETSQCALTEFEDFTLPKASLYKRVLTRLMASAIQRGQNSVHPVDVAELLPL